MGPVGHTIHALISLAFNNFVFCELMKGIWLQESPQSYNKVYLVSTDLELKLQLRKFS